MLESLDPLLGAGDALADLRLAILHREQIAIAPGSGDPQDQDEKSSNPDQEDREGRAPLVPSFHRPARGKAATPG